MAFNLSTLALKDTFELHLRNPATEELLYADEEKTEPVKIVLYGTASKQYRTAINAMQNRQLKRKGKPATPEVMREEGIELLVACSDKSINLSLDGSDATIETSADFRKLYSTDAFSWVKSQVDEALAEIGNFIQA